MKVGRSPLTHSAATAPTNVRRHRDRPVDAVVALLPTIADARQSAEDLRTAGLLMGRVHLLSGMRGSRIVDRYWTRPHRGLRRRRRIADLRGIGYFDVLLGLYGSGLRGHEAVAIVAVDRLNAGPIEAALRAHGATLLTYFALADLERLDQPSGAVSPSVNQSQTKELNQ
jgi:hypothetical protein